MNAEDGMRHPPAVVEPSALLRQGSALLFEMFTAYLQAGFTEAQAIALIGACMQRPAQ